MLNALWAEFLNLAKDEAGSRVVETWLKALTFISWDARRQIAQLGAPNNFIKDWVQQHYLELIKINLGRLLNVSDLQLVFTTTNAAELAPAVIPATPLQLAPLATSSPASTTDTSAVPVLRKKKPVSAVPVPVRAAQTQLSSLVNSTYRFENFVIGPNNTLAHAAAQAVAQQPGTLYNPLFIYGNSGLGKTHLLHAIGNQIKVQHPHATVLYQTTDRFVSEFISAIRFNKVFAFKEKYQAIDVLLIDDIQFISNKDQTQEAFFHIFNALYEAKKQVVFSSDCYPSDITGLAERLRSRLEWGLVTDIYVPARETKIAILKKKAEQHHEALNDELADFIAGYPINNVRELEGILVRVLAFANLTHQALTLELAQRVLGALPSRPTTGIVAATPLERIARLVSQKFTYDVAALQSDDRSKEIAFVRQVTMYLMKQLTDKSLREIGAYLKRRDHTTVSHAIEKIAARMQADQQVRQQIEQLLSELR
ncbi:MAG TPA: chromosomal replication initiator protein DnaA [Candidatus Babeliales bacterium]|nr:chromosomal replication initiator protein DnaA [Candidatus Babeliales bacterium]